MRAIAVAGGFVSGISRLSRAGLLFVSMLLFWLAVATTFAQKHADLAGDWSGALLAGGSSLRLALHVKADPAGRLSVTLDSLDQQAMGLRGSNAMLKGDSFTFEIPSVSGTYNGTLGNDGKSISGTWSQGVPMPLVFTRQRVAQPAELAGDWSGALLAGGSSLRLALHVKADPAGRLSVTLDSLDQQAMGLRGSNAMLKGDSFTFEIPSVSGTYNGTLGNDGKSISGTWSQGVPMPLVFTRQRVAQPAEVVGDWSGALLAGGSSLRLALHVKADPAGRLSVTLDSLDQQAMGLRGSNAMLKGDSFTFEIPSVSGTYNGTLGNDGKSISGTWSQGVPMPLVFTRQRVAQPAEVVGDWSGALLAGGSSLRLALHVKADPAGRLSVTLDSLDQQAMGLRGSNAMLKGDSFTFEIPSVSGTYNGTLGNDGKSISGTWSQGVPMPLVFTRQRVAQPAEVVGDWSGALLAGGSSLRLALHVKADPAGRLSVTLDSLDQQAMGLRGSNAMLKGDSFTFEIPSVSGTYNGTLGNDGKSISGTWSQGVPMPLVFTRQRVAQPAEVVGDWSGALLAGGSSLRLALHVKADPAGRLSVTLDSLDQQAMGLRGSNAMLKGDSFTFEIPSVSGTYNGTLGNDGKSISGTWSQGVPMPLVFTRQRVAQPAEVVGDWSGALLAGGSSLRLALHVKADPAGRLSVTLDSLDQQAMGLRGSNAMLKGDS